MAKRSNLDVGFFLVDGLNLLGFSADLSDSVEAITDDAQPLNSAWPVPTPVGAKKGEFKQSGWFDDATNATHDAFNEQQAVSRVLCYGFESNTIGEAMTGFAGVYASKYTRIVSRNQLHRANADYQISGSVDEGVILHALGAETADGDTESTPVDNSGSSADGGAGFLQVTAIDLDGYDDIAVTVLDSSDDVTYAELVAFTVRTAIGAERKTVAGTVNQYLAAAWAFTGTGTSPSVTFVAGFARG
jgi:hypothetical protein